MPDWDALWNKHYELRIVRAVAFRQATAYAPPVTYAPDKVVLAGIQYDAVGFRLNRGVMMPEDRVQIHIWMRDWFGRATDDATADELQQMVGQIKGQVNAANGDNEMYSRFVVDGSADYKYDRHAFDHRPDGKVFAILVRLQAA